MMRSQVGVYLELTLDAKEFPCPHVLGDAGWLGVEGPIRSDIFLSKLLRLGPYPLMTAAGSCLRLTLRLAVR